MTSGVELLLVGKVTYYALAVYLLFFVGIFLAIRQKFKQRDEDSSRTNGFGKSNPTAERLEDALVVEVDCSVPDVMGAKQSKSKAKDCDLLPSRVEFTVNKDSADDAKVQILTKCVLKKPAGDLSYEIVHDFENDRAKDSSLRKRNFAKSPESPSPPPINGDHSLVEGYTTTYSISHTGYTYDDHSRVTYSDERLGDDLKLESCEIIEPILEIPVSNPVVVFPPVVNGEQRDFSEEDFAAYAILTGELDGGKANNLGHLPDKIDSRYQPHEECSHSISKGSSFDEIVLHDSNDADLLAENGSPAKQKEQGLLQGIHLPSKDLVRDGSSDCERNLLFCLANAVVERSLQEGLSELQRTSPVHIHEDKKSQRKTAVNGMIEEHANHLSREVLSRALLTCADYIRDQTSKPKPEHDIPVVRDRRTSFPPAISDFSLELSEGIILTAVGDVSNRRLLHRRRSLPRRGSGVQNSLESAFIDKFGSALARSIQSGAMGYLRTNTCSTVKPKSPLISEVTEFSGSLANSVLNDAYSRIKVGQYARRMSENIALSAYDSASVILNAVKEQDHFSCELTDRILSSVYNEMKQAVDAGRPSLPAEEVVGAGKFKNEANALDQDINTPTTLPYAPMPRPCILVTDGVTTNDTLSTQPMANGILPEPNTKNRPRSSDAWLLEEEDQLKVPASRGRRSSDLSDTSEDELLPRRLPPPTFRQRRICKGDRPLSGYAEKLAELLAEEDDDLDFLDSDEELETSLDKIEERYGSKPKIGMEISRIRRISSADDSYNSDEHSPTKLTTSDSFDFMENPPPAKRDPLASGLGKEYSDELDALLKGTKPLASVMSPRAYYKTPAVIDAGCGIIKAGMAGELMPSATLPSLVGTPKRFSQDIANLNKSHFVGHAAAEKASMLHTDHPFRSNISNWNEAHSLLEYTLESELGICDSEHPLLLTELALKDKRQREKITEIVFERLGMPAYCLCTQGPLTLYSMGLVSGLCVNAGFSVTQAESIFEGYTLPRATTQLDIGGDTIASYLGRLLLSTRGLSFSSSSERRILTMMMERTGYVTNDIVAEEVRFSKQLDQYEVFTLPDGQEMELGFERCECTEILFDPSILGLGQRPLPEVITNAIASADVEMRDYLAKNIVLSGGTSLLSGLLPRLENGVKKCGDCSWDIKMTRSSEPMTAAWLGGSLLASLSAFSSQWLTLDEYAERGASVIHSRCF